jgi:hypothetical protein
MFIVLNGPLGIGKSTLAEALTESLESCVMLDGDWIIAVNPPQADELQYLHSTVEVLVAHHRRFGYRHFVIVYLWRTAVELSDLRQRLAAIDPDAQFRCFLLTLPADDNLRRIERRQQACAIDDRAYELRTSGEERQFLAQAAGVGEPFDVSAPPEQLVVMMRHRLGL